MLQAATVRIGVSQNQAVDIKSIGIHHNVLPLISDCLNRVIPTSGFKILL